MNYKFPIVLLFFLLPVGLFAQDSTDSLKKIEWILGNWERQNAKPGVTQHEKWWKISDLHYQGIGVAIKDRDTIFVEHLHIKIMNKNVFYIADVAENPAPVHFKFTDFGKSSFVSENPDHDIPKKIAYKIDGDNMTADVSWDDGGFKAVFIKMK